MIEEETYQFNADGADEGGVREEEIAAEKSQISENVDENEEKPGATTVVEYTYCEDDDDIASELVRVAAEEEIRSWITSETDETRTKFVPHRYTVTANGEIQPATATVGAMEEIHSSSQIIGNETKPRNLRFSSVPTRGRRSFTRGRRWGPNGGRGIMRGPKIKKRKPVLIKCTHEGPHFEKSYVDESLNMNQVGNQLS